MKYIQTSGRNFVNEAGETVMLHGINMVCKERKLNHIDTYEDKDFEFLKSLNMNVIRLGIFWESVEPSPGVYDDAYLFKVAAIAKKAYEHGLYTYLDMHQDLFGAKFEDGAPDWAVLDEGLEHIRTDLWSESYLLSPAVKKAFDNFWDNKATEDGVGVMTHFIKAWQHVAGFFAEYPYVIGYDIFNEPFIGSKALEILPMFAGVMEKLENGTATEEDLLDVVSNIETVTGRFEEDILNPFYDNAVKAIREKDPDCLVFLETNYFSNAAVPSHVVPVSLGGEPLKNQVFAPHGYDIFVDTDKYTETDNSRVDMIFATHAAVSEAIGLPMLVGEWGCYPNATEGQLEQARHLVSLFESMGASNTYFDFSHIYNNSIVKALQY